VWLQSQEWDMLKFWMRFILYSSNMESLRDYKTGDCVVFKNNEDVYTGFVKGKMPPYIMILVGDQLWRVLLKNVQSHKPKQTD